VFHTGQLKPPRHQKNHLRRNLGKLRHLLEHDKVAFSSLFFVMSTHLVVACGVIYS
jgi:hypothetical protein